MRIIGGRFRSRLIRSVPGLEVRPTPDRLREALFNVLGPDIEGSVFIDAYAGSGAVGIEALSRGARRAILIERNARAIRVIRANLSALGIGVEALVVKRSAASVAGNYHADIAFLDPPYDRVDEYLLTLTALATSRCNLVVAQHPSRLVLEDAYGPLRKTRVLRQGDNSLSFYSPLPAERPAGESATE